MSFPFTRATLNQCVARKSRSNPMGMTVAQLRAAALQLKLSPAGNKTQLCTRIIEYYEKGGKKNISATPLAPIAPIAPVPVLTQASLPKPKPKSSLIKSIDTGPVITANDLDLEAEFAELEKLISDYEKPQTKPTKPALLKPKIKKTAAPPRPLPTPKPKPKPKPAKAISFDLDAFSESVNNLQNQGYTQILAAFWCCTGTTSDKIWVLMRKPGTTNPVDRATIWGMVQGPYQSRPGPQSPPQDVKLVEQKYQKGYEHSPELYNLVKHLLKPDQLTSAHRFPTSADIRITKGRFVYPTETVVVSEQLRLPASPVTPAPPKLLAPKPKLAQASASASAIGRGVTMTREVRIIEAPPTGCALGKQGVRPSMEDSHVVAHSSDGEVSFYAVFDGHGGKSVAKLLPNALSKLLAKNLATAKIDMSRPTQVLPIIKKTYAEMDQKIFDDKMDSGSTAVGVLKVGNLLYFINLGDSRAILVSGGKVLHDTKDHKPGNSQERERIKAAGGFVSGGMGRTQRVNGILAVSRAFGDNSLKVDDNRKYAGFKAPVSPEPTISTYQLKANQSAILVIACDGLWDVFKNEEVAKLIPEHGSLAGVCEMLIDKAIDERRSRDNVSVMVVPMGHAA